MPWEFLDGNPRTADIAVNPGPGNAILFQRHDSGAIFQFIGPAPQDWRPLDGNPRTVQIVAAGGNQLYQRHNNGAVFQFVGPPTNWKFLDGNPRTVDIAAAGRLYQRHDNGSIFEFVGPAPQNWKLLDNNPRTAQIAAAMHEGLVSPGGTAPHFLYQRHDTGAIFQFTGTPISGWSLLDNNPSTVQIEAPGGGSSRLFQRHNNGAVFGLRDPSPPIG